MELLFLDQKSTGPEMIARHQESTSVRVISFSVMIL